MAPKKNISEEAFNAFRAEVERNGQYLADQLLQKIYKLEEKCNNLEDESNRKIGEVAENYERKIDLIEAQLHDIKLKYENSSRQPVHNECNNKKEQIHNTEISRPIFYGNNRDGHPIDFLYRLEEYFAVKQSYVGEKIIIVGDCLKGTASNWFSTIRFQLTNYDDFKKAFIDEFWSREIQIQVWSQCLSTKHIPNNTNYREHFATWATKLRHLEVPRLSENEIVKHIARHYPGYLRAILVSLPECTILTAMKILGEEEQSDQPTENKANNQKTNQNESNNNSHTQNNNSWNNQRSNGWSNMPPRNNRWNNQPYRSNDKRGETQQNSTPQTEKIQQVATNSEEQAGSSGNEQHAINSLNTTNQSVSPYIQCTIEGEEVTLLIDTGATISVLTKEVVDIITNKNPKIPQLPVTGIQISNAVGKKICKVSKQIFCECKIGNEYIQTNFIQVENLNEKGIIGADILKKYDAQIKFKEQVIQFKIDQTIHKIPFANQNPRVISAQEHLLNVEINESPEEDQVDLTSDEKQQFISLLDKYDEIFSDKPGKIKTFQCQIRVKAGDPIHQKQYPIPVSRIPKVDAEIQRMLKLEIIEKSTSPWSSPIVCTEKKNGDIRLCLDARKINTMIIPDRECPTNMEETLMKFRGMKYLSSIDLTAGYWQCPLKEECREITHVPGRENVGADTLTRYPQSPTDEMSIKDRTIVINKLAILNYSPELREKFKERHTVQQADEYITKLKQRLDRRADHNLIEHNQLLFRKSHQGEYQVIVPKELVQPLVVETHQIYGHCGTYKTYKLLQQNHQFKNMYQTIKRIIKTCDLCQRTKISNRIARGPTLSLLPEKPLEMVSADLMGPLPRGQGGCRYILAILDLFSKYVKLYPLKRATTDTIVKRIVTDYIPTVGLFQKILTDNGTQFTSHKWSRIMEGLKVKIVHTTGYHPESNPVERTNREIGRLLRTYCHKQHTNWLRWLNNIGFWVNHTNHSSTGYTPQYVMFGQNTQLPITKLVTFPPYKDDQPVPDVIQIVIKKTQKQAQLRNRLKDKGKTFPKYEVGMKVLVKEHRLSSAEDHETHKLFLLYHGPYQIHEVHQNNTVTIRSQSGTQRTYNLKNIKLYHEVGRPAGVPVEH
ncbi:uncharacterized protein LOC132936742 [Metopolophium dirhodum]|uniref:uncharacterized protein LOC132936742 n=1 Tax=Metopolophium dirhodum TaxID=44670 RepID=UPI00298FE46F|nr:uncharacterized protein LOC132936742 [Metopolophium dirhodum]